MLRNEMYTGVYLYRDVRIEGGVPVIIEKETFEEVQRRLTQRQAPKGKKAGTAEYILTGKLFCGYCQEPMVGISGTGRHGETHYYYRCQGKHHKKNGCHKKNAPRDLIENAVIQRIRDFIMNDEILDQIIEDYYRFLESAREDSALTSMQAELEQNRKAAANIIKAIESGLFNDMMKARLEELENERKDLEASIRFEQQTLTELSPEQLRFHMEQLRHADFNDKNVRNDLVRIFIRAVYLFDDHLKFVFNFDADQDYTITFEQVCGDDTSGLVGSYKIPSGVLSADDTNPAMILVFYCGFVISAPI